MDKEALHDLSYGLYVVSSVRDGECNGQIANTVFQVTSKPPVISVCINKENLTHEFIEYSSVFAVSVLSKDVPMGLVGNFGFKSGRGTDKFSNVEFRTGKIGAPILTENTISYIEAEVLQEVDVGTHTIFIGEVVDAEVLAEGDPMTYSYYRKVKKGTAPSTAPTYIEGDLRSGDMQKYRCTVCGYVYDPEEGDPDSGTEPGTAFEDLPEDWACPVCGAPKEKFEPI